MIDLERFRKGMEILGAAFNREITAELSEAFARVLSPRLDTTGWERAVTRVLEAESFFPAPAVLLRYGRAEGAAEARAAEVYERILASFEAGCALGPREVRERFGEAALDAFVAAGGSRAFAWCEPKDAPFRFKRFLDAWMEVVEQAPERALPTGDSCGLLDTGGPA